MHFGLLDGPGELRFDANVEAFKEMEFAMDMDELPKYITGIRAPLSIDAEMLFEMDLNVPEFMKLTRIDIACGKDMTATLICRDPYQVQRKRNKKKRINKKWAKKYGYVTKFRNYRLENVEIHQDGGILDIAANRGYFLI